jgi:hypothetical protein
MAPKYLKVCGILAWLAVAVACGSSVTQPSSSTQPQPMSPGDGQQITYAVQPVTLTAQNAVTTGSTPLTYTFQVATDAGFANVVYTKADVPQGTGQTTSLTIGTLPGKTTYYWRVQPFSGSFAGLPSKARSFAVGPQVVLEAPVVMSPLASGIVGGTPTLTVTNVGRTGPAGPLTYQFDVADSPDFSHIVFTTSVAEQSGQTSAQVTTSLSAATYYWRVQVTDATNGVTSPFSSASSFQVLLFNMSQATMIQLPANLATWAQTANITLVDWLGYSFRVDFDKRDGPGRWPDVPFHGGPDYLEYTLGMCLNISGQWYCAAPIQFWYGRDIGASAFIARDWFYDSRWGPMKGYQPAFEELVGIFVVAGDLRDNPGGTGSYAFERSNVLLIPWGTSYSASASSVPGALRLLSVPRRGRK